MSRPNSGSQSDSSVSLIDAGQPPFGLAEAKLAAWEIAICWIPMHWKTLTG